MGPTVEKVPLHRPQVFPPLLLNVDEGPLAAAECKVLQAGQLEEVLLGIGHPMRWQVTPAGRAASSTETI